MTKTEQKSLRLTTEAVNQAFHLARVWSHARPLSLADVVTEAVRRAYEAEAKSKKEKAK